MQISTHRGAQNDPRQTAAPRVVIHDIARNREATAACRSCAMCALREECHGEEGRYSACLLGPLEFGLGGWRRRPFTRPGFLRVDRCH